METVETENKEGQDAKGESKPPTQVGLKENLANSNAEAKKDGPSEDGEES